MSQSDYAKIKEYIVTNINARRWLPGNPVMSVEDAMNMFQANRPTVDRVYRDLVREGVLRGVKGVGVMVSPDPKDLITVSAKALGALIRAHSDMAQKLKITEFSDPINELKKQYSATIEDRTNVEKRLRQRVPIKPKPKDSKDPKKSK